MRKLIVLLALSCPLCAVAQFQIQDIRIGSTTASYIDFEFFQKGNRMVFQDENNNAYVAQMDSLTGNLVTATGKDFLVDSNLVPFTSSLNGPEWGLRQGGADVYYTSQTATKSIGKATFNGLRYQVQNLSQTLTGNRFGTLCSKNESDTQSSLIYAKGNNLFNFDLYYSPASNPVVDSLIPNGRLGSSGPRFIDGDRALLTNALVNGYTQIFRYDLASGGLRQLTFDPTNKIDAFIFTAPDFGGSRMLFCTVNDSLIRLYREVSGVFTRQYDIDLPDTSYHFYFSAEPFIFQNQSFLFLCGAARKFTPGSPTSSLPADVWLIGLEPTRAFYRKVSDSRVALRLDPEVYITPTEAYIYYYEYNQNNNIYPVALHKCSTGLVTLISPIQPSIPEAKTSFAFPNPATNVLLLSPELRSGYLITFTNMMNQIVLKANSSISINLTNIPAGLYRLRAQNQQYSFIQQLVITK
jgi:hypothetical protein